MLSDNPAHLDETVEKVIMQFSLGKRRRFSNWLPSEEKETRAESDARKSLDPGIRFIAPTPNIRIGEVPNALRAIGFTLVDVIEMPRHDRNNPGRTYYAARFTFARTRYNTTHEWDNLLDETFYPALVEMSSECCWRVRAYRNPLYRNGERVPGQSMLSMNFEAPAPPDMSESKVRGALRLIDQTLSVVPAH